MSKDPQTESLVFLHGFAKASTKQFLVPSSGVEEDSVVTCLDHQGLCAIISLVPAKAYEQEPLQKHVQDPKWITQRAQRHNQVLLETQNQTPVVPCRFGSVFRNREAVKKLIEQYKDQLARAFSQLGDQEEWSVKAFWIQRTEEEEQKSKQEKEKGMDKKTQTSGGAAYLFGRIRERDKRREEKRRIYNRAEEILRVVSTIAHDVALLPVRDFSASPKNLLFLNLACLIRRKDTDLLQSKLEKLARQEHKHDIALSWSGPWPAYSFVEDIFSDTASHLQHL